MKHLLLAVVFFLVLVKVQSQNVGIGTSTPVTILDVTSTTKGILIPRLTTVQMNAIVSPASGLLITNTDSSNRLFIYTGTAWKGLSFTSEGSLTDTALLVHKAGTETITGYKIFTTDISINGLTIGRGGGGDSTNTAIGNKALFLNSYGQYNTALGDSSQFANVGGFANTSIGNTALFSNITGGSNTADGYQALYSNTAGDFNTGGGAYALYYNAAGKNNVAYGFIAAAYLADGVTPLLKANNSLFLGANTMAQADNQTNQIVIGNDAIGDGDNSTVIGSAAILSTKLQGKLKLPAYGTGTNTGTAVFNLAADASGNIIEVPTGGGGGGGDAFLANTQTFTKPNTFDSGVNIRQYLGNSGLLLTNKSNGSQTSIKMTTPIGVGPDLTVTADRFIVDGYLRLTNGTLEAPNGLGMTMGNQNYQIYGGGDFVLQTSVNNINIVHGGYNKGTQINSYTGFPLTINDGGAGNGTGNVLIGTASDDASNKLQVNGSVKSSQYKLSALNVAPSSATDTGALGEIRVTATHIYVCIATNTWVRSPLATW